MLKYFWYFLLVHVFTTLVSCSAADQDVVLNDNHPTSPPLPAPTGLFKFVQECENFCDVQKDKVVEDSNVLHVIGIDNSGVIACRKGCYSFELFKTIVGKKRSIHSVDKVCHTSCNKDYADNKFVAELCSRGCFKMSKLYQDKIQELRQSYISKLRAQNKDLGDLDSEDMDRKAERFLKERDEEDVKKMALAVIMAQENEYGVRILTAKRLGHMRNIKEKIFHVERLSANHNPGLKRYLEIESRLFSEDEETQKQDPGEETVPEHKTRGDDRKKTVVMKLPSFPKRVDTECLLFQVPIYVLTVLVFFMIAVGLWITYGDAYDCFFCMGRKFWEKMEHMDPYGMDPDEDELVAQEKYLDKHMNEISICAVESTRLSCADYPCQDYTSPPPDKDAPPPYVEINLSKSESNINLNNKSDI